MRLAHVLIESFRGIGRLELDLDRLTVVIGENNHGKSSLLDVLERCLGRPDAPAPTHFEPTDFRRTDAPTPAPIRVLLTFGHDEAQGRAATHPGVFDMATVHGAGGKRLVRVEFTGEPTTGAMHARFVDTSGRPLDPQPHAVVLSRLRQLHPVLVVRLAQPHVHDPLQWRRAEDREDYQGKRRSEHGSEQDIARVYRRLVEARGPVPPEDVRRALRSAYDLRTTLAERYLAEPGSLGGLLGPLVGDGRVTLAGPAGRSPGAAATRSASSSCSARSSTSAATPCSPRRPSRSSPSRSPRSTSTPCWWRPPGT